MGIVTSWVASHTGLPSFYLRGPGSLMSGDRLVAHLADGDEKLFSDAGAPMTAPTEYVFGGEAVTLSRAFLGVGNAIIADISGRGVSDVIWEDTKDAVSWNGSGVTHESGVDRFSLRPPAVTGESTISLLNARSQIEFERVVRERSYVWLIPAEPTVGLPASRLVFVREVSRSRITVSGILRYKIAWAERDPTTALPAPVVTWGEWQEWGDQPGNPSGWQNWSYVEVCQRVAGMPEVD